MEGFSPAQASWIRSSVHAGAALSLLGSAFILSVYLAFSDLRCYAFRLVAYLAVLDVLTGVWYFLPDSRGFCVAQAVLLSYFSLASVLMTACIAFALYKNTVQRKEATEELDSKFLALTLLVPAILAFLPLISSDYGRAGGWCWVMLTEAGFTLQVVWRLATFYVPLWLVALFNCFVYCQVFKAVSRECAQTTALLPEEGLSLLKKLIWYPLVLVVSYLPISLVRLLETLHPGRDNFYFLLFAGLAISLSGFFNALVYGFTVSVRYRLLVCCFPHRRASFAATQNRELQ